MLTVKLIDSTTHESSDKDEPHIGIHGYPIALAITKL